MRHSFNKSLILSLAFQLIIVSLALSQENPVNKPATKIQPGDPVTEISRHLAFLASDELAGRKIGTEGFERALDYAKEEFSLAGVIPLFRNKKSESDFLQPVNIIERSWSGEGSFIVKNRARKVIIPSTDFRYFNLKDDSLFHKNLPLVFIDHGIYEPDAGWNELAGLDLRGKIAVVKAGVPAQERVKDLPDSLVAKNGTINGTIGRMNSLAQMDNRPEGIILIADEKFLPIWPRIRNTLSQPCIIPGIPLPNRILLFPTDLLIIKPEAGSALINLSENDDSHYINRNTHQNFYLLKDTRISMDIPFKDSPIESWNLGGYFPGSDPSLRYEFIIVGAHIDHLGIVDGEVMNGADDNASGCAAVFELARRFKNLPTNRSVAFVIWTGEESEAMGSQQFLANSPIPVEKIKGYINFDMIGRVAPENQETGAIYISTTDEYHDSVKSLLETIEADKHKPAILLTGDGLSDHFAFSANQIFSFGFYSGHHEDVHKPGDDIEKLDVQRIASTIEIAEKMILHLANN